MNVKGMTHRNHIPGKCSIDNNTADTDYDEELNKKTAHSSAYLWLHRQFGLLTPRRRFLSTVFIVGAFCLTFSIRRITVFSSSLGGTVATKNSRPGVYPRYIQYAYDRNVTENKSLRLEPNAEHYPSKRVMFEPMSEPKNQEILADSDEYETGQLEIFETADCKAQYSWQMASFPTCNNVLEFDLTSLFDCDTGVEKARLLANGFWRDVWSVREGRNDEKRVLKTMRYPHDYTPRNFDRHRRDAVAMERLTKSNFVVDIYGFCGNSGLFEYADGGDIKDAILPHDDNEPNVTQIEKLQIATQAAIGLAAVHNIDREGQASIAHTDISPSQFIKISGIYKLNDFNRARFIRWNRSKNKTCYYHIGKNPGKNRSPEEYAYKRQSEKVDVYSLGNIFFMLLQSEWPFSDVTTHEAKKLVKDGYRPSFYADIWNSTDPVDQALKEAMFMCHEQESSERATARQVENYLKKKLFELDPGRLSEWGVATH